MNIALLIIDMQKAFFTNTSKESMKKAAEYINYTVDLFREYNKKIFWIQDEDEEDGNVNGTEGFEIIELLKPKENEQRIIKHYGNGFNKTELLEIIVKEKIDTIVITGFSAEYCVLSTYRGALDNDLTPIILKKAIASGTEENIKFVENITEIITIKILEKIIKEE
jgi:nicotinamidase-related amidase